MHVTKQLVVVVILLGCAVAPSTPVAEDPMRHLMRELSHSMSKLPVGRMAFLATSKDERTGPNIARDKGVLQNFDCLGCSCTRSDTDRKRACCYCFRSTPAEQNIPGKTDGCRAWLSCLSDAQQTTHSLLEPSRQA